VVTVNSLGCLNKGSAKRESVAGVVTLFVIHTNLVGAGEYRIRIRKVSVDQDEDHDLDGTAQDFHKLIGNR
jgi:hypothetical protein